MTQRDESNSDQESGRMGFFMVFAGERRQVQGTAVQAPTLPRTSIVWEPLPVGVFRAQGPEAACRAAARKHGRAGTFFAIAGYPWGIEMMAQEGVEELGSESFALGIAERAGSGQR